MLAFQGISRLFVIEGFRIPFDEGKVFTIVLGVAAHTLLAGTGRKMIGSVQALALGQALGYFCMAVQAFECCLSRRQFVTAAATTGSV